MPASLNLPISFQRFSPKNEGRFFQGIGSLFFVFPIFHILEHGSADNVVPLFPIERVEINYESHA